MSSQPAGTGSLFLDTIKDAQSVNGFTVNTILSAVFINLGFAVFVFILFCFLRPRHSVIYAPKSKYADSKHSLPAPPKNIFTWLVPVAKCKEDVVEEKLGMDATIFLRFVRMLRNIFLAATVLTCLVIIPVNVALSLHEPWVKNQRNISKQGLTLVTPQYVWGTGLWATVAVSYVFDAMVLFFIWFNYRRVVQLRQKYMMGPEYRRSIQSRTLMVRDVPSSYRTDSMLRQLVSEATNSEDCIHAQIGRNVRELPELIDKHTLAVKELERHLANYLQDPTRLPAHRPTCRANEDGGRVDAIDYYTQRIKLLEEQIAHMRHHIDQRGSMPYGFVSYASVSAAHNAARAAASKHLKGTTIRLAPLPTDIVWANLTRAKPQRRSSSLVGHFLFALLTVVYIVPNALISTFLSNLSRLSLVWPWFTGIYNNHQTAWAVVQGFLAPMVLAGIYLLLPTVMRRISVWQGKVTKTSRERAVFHKLYLFYAFNSLVIFTIFSTLWGFIAQVIGAAERSGNSLSVWQAIRNFHTIDQLSHAIILVSSFFLTYLIQRNLSAMLDLAQLFNLFYKTFMTHFFHSTPRQLIEWTAADPFAYAEFYSWFLFYTTIAFCFGLVQPLVLPMAAFYFTLDAFLKKYTLMYVNVTKNESGGAFWRTLINRLLFALGFGNVVWAAVIWVQSTAVQGICVLPLLLIILAFKIFCSRVFDARLHFLANDVAESEMATTAKSSDRMSRRFEHPALHHRLLVPMVHAKATHLLPEVYSGRLSDDDKHNAFEFVTEDKLDYSAFRNRPDFAGDNVTETESNFDALSMRSATPVPRYEAASPSSQSPQSARPTSPLSQLPTQLPMHVGGRYREDAVPESYGYTRPAYGRAYSNLSAMSDAAPYVDDRQRLLSHEIYNPRPITPRPSPRTTPRPAAELDYTFHSYDDYRR